MSRSTACRLRAQISPLYLAPVRPRVDAVSSLGPPICEGISELDQAQVARAGAPAL